MRVIQQIDITLFDISRIKDMYNQGLLFIDNTFQRRYVWEEKHKIALIETILLGYDIPPVYLWQQEPEPNSGKVRYSVVDGQQRIGAIISYLNNEFGLSRKYLSEQEDHSWINKRFSELDDGTKRIIWSYQLKVEKIDSEIEKEQIQKLFLRLNITNKSLNPQELRNASFHGKFLKNSLRISELDFWKKYDVFSANDIRRMKDVEFASNLLIFLRKGIKTNVSQTIINEMYDYYNDEYTEANEDFEIVSKIINLISEVMNLVSHPGIRKTTHIYSMFVAFYALDIQNDLSDREKVIETIADFYSEYFSNLSDDENIVEYMNAAIHNVNGSQNRGKRMWSIINYVHKRL